MKHRDKLLLVSFITILVVVVVAVFVHFGSFFDYMPDSTDLEGWMNTAVYFNNVFSPFFLLLSVTLLYLTWITTKSELVETRKLLLNQMKSQEKKEFIENTIRKSKKLDELFHTEYKLSDIDKLIPHDLGNIIAELNEDQRLKIYNSLGISIYKFESTDVKDLTELDSELYDYLKNYKVSYHYLINNGRSVSLREGANIKAADYFESNVSKNNTCIRKVLENTVSLHYYREINTRTEIKHFYKLVDFLLTAEEEYRQDLYFEFMLTFDSSTTEILITINDKLNNDCFDINLDTKS